MKFALVFIFATVFALAVAQPVAEEPVQGVANIRNGYHKYTLADRDYLKKYKEILSLFKYVHQSTCDKEHLYIAKHYSIESNLDSYSNSKAVNDILNCYRLGMLPKNEIFSVFNENHLREAIALFKVLYYAKDFETFYKTAVWARYYLNQGMFLYALSVAIIHHQTAYSMILPPIYEVYPYYFFSSEVIQKAQEYKQRLVEEPNRKDHVIYTNYSTSTSSRYAEQSLSYFTEDIGVNAYYYYYNLYRPFWMDTKEYDINTYYRGEEFNYFYQQFLARYNLERLTNGISETQVYNYNGDFKTRYYTGLRYPNGLIFPERNYFFPYCYNKEESYEKVSDHERRIRDAIDLGYIYAENGQKINLLGSDGLNILGNIIESNPDSPNRRFYGHLQLFARHLLAYPHRRECDAVGPSALAHFETSLRDPEFWQLYKRLLSYLQQYKNYLPSYTNDELLYQSVKIESVTMDRLTTYFEMYDADITNAVYVNENEWESTSFAVYARKQRLNHKPFTYTINVTSENIIEVVVRVFIGPKYDAQQRHIPINENRINFVEFDKFKYELKSGQNIIGRNSNQIYYASDRMNYRQLNKLATSGINGTGQFVTHGSEVYYAFPNRLLLPKGTRSGQTFQFYVIVSPYKPPLLLKKIEEEEQSIQHIYDKLHEGEEYEYFKNPMVGLGVQYLDNYPLGYPFDKPIDNNNFDVPNSYFQDVIIYHQD